MNRFRVSIAAFLASLLSAGLLISTLHVHKLLDRHAHIPVDTIHILDQAHDTCPICAVVFEGVSIEENSGIMVFKTVEDSPFVTDQVKVTPVYSDKDGRSPPFIV